MSNKTLEDKAVEILDASQTAIASFAEKLTELAKQYGPDVMDAALQMARIDAIDTLMPGVIGLAFVIIGWRLALKFNPDDWDEPSARGVACLCSGAIGVIGAVFALTNLFNTWAWVGIFEPKLWLAKRVLGL